MKTAELVTIFEDTQNRVHSTDELKKATIELIDATKVYQEDYISKKRVVKNDVGDLSVVQDTSFSCASKFDCEGKTVTVLNFANPHEPGGGVKRGAKAQEECLCRCSNLYDSISNDKVYTDYYGWNKELNGYLFSDRVIYSPGVLVIKDDEYVLLEEPFRVDVITCAAPYNVYGHDINVLKECYIRRIKNILEVAIGNDVDILILGAFGCGVFHNPPSLMAECFKSVLLDEKYACFFEKVIFAIPKPSAFDRNYDAFLQVLGGMI